ncbi:alpha/beta hydrolase [Undibacterium sp. RTI2.1]|uniref:alpha/beta fold hydrolase n=1 Tax=unclassified Undibacterium TaxID=2630295 RepID=UPI002B2233A2|nr:MULTISPECIES: alpha/beta hydrolase [unclassified Undibacterium]MEB0029325.1 alpha/beta hydrolase [Undibacterium sp. RTI2.1]MEB0115633.1 alpha/beta hydrolase [Undibacterium sp. RTI2.2]
MFRSGLWRAGIGHEEISLMASWVLLRGLMREQRHWGDFPQMFQVIAADAAVVTLDFPGNGHLCEQVSATSVEAMVESVRLQLLALSHPPPYHVAALSLGAMAAVAWSRLYPGEVEKMVLINTSLAPHNPFYHRLRPQNYPALLGTLLRGTVEHREALIMRITSKQADTQQAPALLKRWVAYAEEYPIRRGNILRQLAAALRYRAPYAAPPMPTLLLAGLGDDLVNPACSRQLAELWSCEIKLHPSAGHDLPLDDAGWVMQQIANWLSTQR